MNATKPTTVQQFLNGSFFSDTRRNGQPPTMNVNFLQVPQTPLSFNWLDLGKIFVTNEMSWLLHYKPECICN
jgi:hypothetical protein